MTFNIRYDIINIEKKKKGDFMGKVLSQEIINQIPLLYEELKNKTKVAERLGISVASVNKYLTVLPAAPQEKKRKERIKITQEIIDKINDLYPVYKSMKKVAEEIGCSSSTVKKYLSEENLSLIKQQNDDRDALWYYIYRLFGPAAEDKPVSDWNITQIQRFKAQGMPYRGQLLTLKYFYEIKKNSIEKARGSVGIINYVWDEASQYYSELEKKQKEIGEAIKRQLEQDRIEIKYNPNDSFSRKRKKRKEIDLSTIGEDLDDTN